VEASVDIEAIVEEIFRKVIGMPIDYFSATERREVGDIISEMS